MTALMQMAYEFDQGQPSLGPKPEMGFLARPDWARADVPGDAEGAVRHPEWAALRARFLAIHALHHTLAANAESLLPGGAFADAGGAVLAACRQRLTGVNLTCSANGKVGGAKDGEVAAFPTPGDRGIQ